jgi:hypothetical protein
VGVAAHSPSCSRSDASVCLGFAATRGETSQRSWLSVERLPRYAPKLNPTEQVFGSVKSNALANQCQYNWRGADFAEVGLDRIGNAAPLCIAFSATRASAYERTQPATTRESPNRLEVISPRSTQSIP